MTVCAVAPHVGLVSKEAKQLTTEKRGRFIINFGYWILIIAIVFVAFKYLIPLIMPFFLALVFSAIMRPAVKFLNKKCHIRQNIAALICIVIFFILIGAVAVAVGAKAVSIVSNTVQRLSSLYTSSIEPGMQQLFLNIEESVSRFSPEVRALVENIEESLMSSIGDMVKSISSGIISGISTVAGRFPRMLLSTLMCVIATVFMSVDFPRLTAALMRQFPEKTKQTVHSVKHAIVGVIFRYGRSYALIMCITFAELLAGFLIIGVSNKVMMAVIIAVVDIFPVVGSGLFLWPWAAILLVQGNIAQGIGMIILYVVIMVVRQYIEPKIIGGHVGLHPLITLMCMFIGVSLFGGIGLFGLPILAATVKSLNDSGVIHVFKSEADCEGAECADKKENTEKSDCPE